MSSQPVTPVMMRRTVAGFATGLSVVAAEVNGRIVRMPANSLSLDPPLVSLAFAPNIDDVARAPQRRAVASASSLRTSRARGGRPRSTMTITRTSNQISATPRPQSGEGSRSCSPRTSPPSLGTSLAPGDIYRSPVPEPWWERIRMRFHLADSPLLTALVRTPVRAATKDMEGASGRDGRNQRWPTEPRSMPKATLTRQPWQPQTHRSPKAPGRV